MKKYRYGKKTPAFGFPQAGPKDALSAEIEFKKLVAIENAILAAIGKVENAVFDEGRFAVKRDAEDEYSLILAATGVAPSLSGVVNRRFFEAAPLVRWKGLARGEKHYLYVAGSRDLASDKGAVRTVSARRLRESDRNMLLVATLDLRKSQPDLDVSPPGKVYAGSMARHARDNRNPHGETLRQTSIDIDTRVALRPSGGFEGAPIQVDDRREGNFPAMSCTKELLLEDEHGIHQVADPDDPALRTRSRSIVGAINEVATREVIVHFDTGGTNGVEVEIGDDRVVVLVLAERRGSLDDSVVGETGFEGGRGRFTFYNSGDVGIPMVAVVHRE